MASFNKLNPQFRPWAEYLFYLASVNNLAPKLTSGYRSLTMQKILYARYLRGAHPLPVAPPGQSMHNYGLAVDIVSRNNAALGALWQSWGGRWGGSKDPVHFGV